MKFYERVISDFGGYEKCKDILSQPNIDFIMNAQGLREHMLEYRRQHNIYEVGDLVVGRCYEDYDDSILTITEKFDHFGNPSVVFECERTICDDFESELRHATDAEIAAGRRL